MKLTYQTGIGTLIQFIVLSIFTLVSQVSSVVTTCHKDGGNCISNLITSIIFYILIASALGVIWLIGYAAQDKRSKRLAQLLICIEGLIALLALLNIKVGLHQHKNAVGQIAGFGILVLASWIVTLAYRLMRAGGSRVMRQRNRQP